MDDASFDAFATDRNGRPLGRRLQRGAARLAARCAMGSWLVLAAMPIVVLVCALS